MLKNRIDSSKINYCRKNLRTPSSVKSYSWMNNMTESFAMNCNLRRLRVLSSQMNYSLKMPKMLSGMMMSCCYSYSIANLNTKKAKMKNLMC